MPTKTDRPVKPARSVRVIHGDAPLIISITADKITKRYVVVRFDSDWGEAFYVCTLEKGGNTYDVCIDGADSICDCKGFTYGGSCRHVAALQALYERGAIKPRTEAPKGDAWEGL